MRVWECIYILSLYLPPHMHTHVPMHFSFLLYSDSLVPRALMQTECKQEIYLEIIRDGRKQGLMFESFPQGLIV